MFGESSRPKTVFISHCGFDKFRVLSFGWRNVQATFQRLAYKHVSCSICFTLHLLPQSSNSIWKTSEVLTRILGYHIGPECILPDQSKVRVVSECRIQSNVKEVTTVIGFDRVWPSVYPKLCSTCSAAVCSHKKWWKLPPTLGTVL